MLRTNSKQARANLRKYIMEHCDFSNYFEPAPTFSTFEECAAIIRDTFEAEKGCSNEYARAKGISKKQMFRDWCQGLPSGFDTSDIFYHPCAVRVVGDILEESEEERARFTESQAEELFIELAYREIFR